MQSWTQSTPDVFPAGPSRFGCDLAQRARLRLLGELVPCIVHEINQPIFAIRNLAAACRNALSAADRFDGQKLQEWAALIEREAARTATLITRLHLFAHNRPIHPTPFEVSSVVREAADWIAHRALSDRIDVGLMFDGPLPTAFADPQHVLQVAFDLLANACDDAVAAGTRRVIVEGFRVRQSPCIRISAVQRSLPPKQRNSCLRRSGSKATSRARFGLALSRSLIRANGGRLWIESQEGHSCDYCFSLPICQNGARHD